MQHPPDEPSVLAPGGENAIAWSIGVTADEWTLLIIQHALRGVRRYNDWRQVLSISHAVLTSRLRRLEELGMLRAVPYQDRPRRLEYLLTPRGRGIWPVLVGIWSWEAEDAVRHVHCGQVCRSVMSCGECGQDTGAREITGEFGPSGSWPRSVPAANTRRRSHGSSPGLLPDTTALIGNRWSAALVGAAFFGARRFSEFQERMGAPAAIVADRLRTFCARGVLRQEDATYRLTDKGRAFFPVVLASIDWGQRWFHAPEGPAMVFRHGEHTFRPTPRCDQCGQPLAGDSIIIEAIAPDATGDHVPFVPKA